MQIDEIDERVYADIWTILKHWFRTAVVCDWTIVLHYQFECRSEPRIGGSEFLNLTMNLHSSCLPLKRFSDDGCDIFIVGMNRRERD